MPTPSPDRTHQRCALVRAVFLLALPACLGGGVGAQEPLPQVIRRVQPSTVLVLTFDPAGRRLLQGSGFFAANPGLVVTSRHVLEGASSAIVKTADGKLHAVRRLVAEDHGGDLAMLSTDVAENDAPVLTVVTGLPEVGTEVVVVGSPLGLEQTATTGIVSAVRALPAAGKVIQMTAPISPGSSGSPVVNLAGEVVGVASALMVEGQNLNFAVPGARVLALKPGLGLALSSWSRRARPEDSQDVQALCARGRALLDQGNFGAALPLFDKASSLEPPNADALQGLGECFLGLRRGPEAESALQRAIMLRPEAPQAYVCLGQAFALEGRHSEAIENFQLALRLRPASALAYLSMGESYAGLGMDHEACQAWQQAILNDRECFDGYENLGEAYMRLRRTPEAQEAFKQGVRLRPDSWEAHLRLGRAYAVGGRQSDAVACYKEAIRLKPGAALAHYALADSALAVGDRGLALEEYGILKGLDRELADKVFKQLYH